MRTWRQMDPYTTDLADSAAVPDMQGLPYVNPRDKKYASRTMANISRAEWEDYQSRFMPVEQELLDIVQDPAVELDERLAAITINNNEAFRSSAGSFDRTMSRYGTQGDGAVAHQRSLDQSREKTASIVDAQNNTRRHVVDRNMAVLGGGTGTRQAIEDM